MVFHLPISCFSLSPLPLECLLQTIQLYIFSEKEQTKNPLSCLQIKELEAGGVKPQDSKIDTGLGAKRKVCRISKDYWTRLSRIS